MIEVIQIPVLRDNYIYLLIDKVTKETACVDPALSKPVLNELEKRKLKLNYILNTHHHNDHVGGNYELKEKTNCKIVGFAKDKKRIPGIEIEVEENDEILVGTSSFLVIEVPGHTLGHICYYNNQSKILFCGDTLFSVGCGRLFEGSPKQMWSSLKKIRCLPDETKIFCAHEYTESNINFAIQIDPKNKYLSKKKKIVRNLRKNNQPTIPFILGEEKKINPFLRVDEKNFKNNLGLEKFSPENVFKEIRIQKDQF